MDSEPTALSRSYAIDQLARRIEHLHTHSGAGTAVGHEHTATDRLASP